MLKMKPMFKIQTVIAISLLAGTPSAGAETWSLERCVAYALEHNISVQQSKLQILEGEQTLTEAKDRFLPTVNGSVGQSWSFGRGLTSENTYANRNTSNFQWGASASLPLFQGLSEYRQLDVAKANLQQIVLNTEATKDNVTLNVISQYLQVLYQKEVLESARIQLGYSQYEAQRQKTLVENGKVPEADLLDAEAQMAQDSLTVVSSQNDLNVALVELTNLLRLPTPEGFDVQPLAEGEPMIPTAQAVYDSAMNTNNSLMAARQGIKVAESNISLAKTGYIPTLSFSTSIGSSYYTMSGLKSESFRDQMRHNYSTYIGLNLSIPIFNAFSTRNSVRKARLHKISAELTVDQTETELYRNIQLAYYQAKGARDRYFTSLETLNKTEASFAATQEKYNLGRATPTEFEQAKNNLFRTRVSSIQAHYEYLLRHRILIFYQSNKL